jgi:hypothetical protein
VEPFHPVVANPIRVIGTVAACALGIFGTMGPSKGKGMMLTIRNMERATARYPSFAIAIYYRYRNLIIVSAVLQKQGTIGGYALTFLERARRDWRAFKRAQTTVRGLLILRFYFRVFG